MTCFGTWVPAGPSRNAEPWRLNCKVSEGNCSLTQAISNAFVSALCITGVLIGSFPMANGYELRPLVSHTLRLRCRCAACCAPTCLFQTGPRPFYSSLHAAYKLGPHFPTIL